MTFWWNKLDFLSWNGVTVPQNVRFIFVVLVRELVCKQTFSRTPKRRGTARAFVVSALPELVEQHSGKYHTKALKVSLHFEILIILYGYLYIDFEILL